MFLLIVGDWEILEGYTRNFGAVGTRKKTRQGWEESVPRVYLHAFWLLNHLKALPFKRFKNCNKTKIILRKKISITQLPEYNGHITSHMRTFFVSGEVSQGEHLDEKGHPPLPEWAVVPDAPYQQAAQVLSDFEFWGNDQGILIDYLWWQTVRSWVQCRGQMCPGHKTYFNFCVLSLSTSPQS